MPKFITKTIGLVAVLLVGYSVYDGYKAGYFNLPDMPEGAYQISFASGLRGIILEAEVSDASVGDYPKWMRRLSQANPERRYLGLPFDVPEWFVGAWSYCQSPNQEEKAELARTLPQDMQIDLTGARFDFICRLNLDSDEQLLTGLIFSVPQL